MPPMAFRSQIPPHPRGTFLFIEDVGLCDAVDALLAAAPDGFVPIRRDDGGAHAEPWATAAPASWLVPGARRCDVWRWAADGHRELRCDLGIFDEAMAQSRAHDTFRAIRQCLADRAGDPAERERAYGATRYRELSLALPASGRRVALSSVCADTCNLSLVIE